mmetsp:Transcript_30027/g.77794  ORF Transcript_30027/g.77794 Transcript_30027/m.77794 type:complete len:227 (+) Transcript_30027:67-747(+)
MLSNGPLSALEHRAGCVSPQEHTSHLSQHVEENSWTSMRAMTSRRLSALISEQSDSRRALFADSSSHNHCSAAWRHSAALRGGRVMQPRFPDESRAASTSGRDSDRIATSPSSRHAYIPGSSFASSLPVLKRDCSVARAERRLRSTSRTSRNTPSRSACESAWSSDWNCSPYGSDSDASSSSRYRRCVERISPRSSSGKSSRRISPRAFTSSAPFSLFFRYSTTCD